MIDMFWQKHRTGLYILLISVAVVSSRLAYLGSSAGKIGDADEAVFGLMAQRIEALKEFPIYCWQAHYAGAPVSYVAAVIFHFAGSSFVTLRLAMLPVALLAAILFYLVYRKLFTDNEALIGAMLMVFCPFIVLHHTMAAYGGYGETLLGTALIIFLSWNLQSYGDKRYFPLFCSLLGFVCGFFFYILFLVAPAVAAFALPAMWLIKRRRILCWSCYAGGVLVGLMPMIIYNVFNHGGTLTRSLVRSFSIGRESMGDSWMQLSGHLASAKYEFIQNWLHDLPVMLGMYFLPAGMDGWLLPAGLSAIVILLWFTVIAFKARKQDDRHRFLFQFLVFTAFLILFVWAGNLNRVRHLMPFIVIIPVVFLALGNHFPYAKRTLIGFLSMFCILNVVDWINQFSKLPFNPAPIAALIKRSGIKEFYGSYWTTYPIIFSTHEAVIGSPAMLSHGEIFSDRLPDLAARIRASASPGFVFGPEEILLKKEFVQFLVKQGITWKSGKEDGSDVIFGLSERVWPVPENNKGTTFSLKCPDS